MITIVALDFSTKQERAVTPDELSGLLGSGLFFWVDIDCSHCPDKGPQCGRCEALLRTLRVNEVALAEVIGPDREGRYDVYEDCLHFAVTEARLGERRLQTAHVDVVLGEQYLVTYRRSEADFVKQMRRTYRDDFIKFARTPGFLLYEIGDHLTERYRRALQSFGEAVEQTQLKLFANVDDEIFRHVADLTSDILVLRKIVLASRELFHELATRKSPFVPEATQTFLGNLAGTLDRLGADLSTERDVLNNTLGLYMGMVSHRTNKIISRLTVISVIFLPLGFIVSLYGSNFRNIPGTASSHGFGVFCLLCLALAATLVWLMKRKRWI